MTESNSQKTIRLTMADHAPDISRSWLSQHAPWALTTGHRVPHTSQKNWAWIDNTDREICRYTGAQLKAGWDEIVRQSDMTLELMHRIDWTQLDTMIVRGVVSVVCMADGEVFGVLLKDDEARAQSKQEALPAIFIALLVIVGTASAEGLAALAAALGIGTS